MVCAKDVPSEGGVDTTLHLGVRNPQNPQFLPLNAGFPAKSIHLNNYRLVGDRRVIPVDQLYKIRVR
jgi:hypothetical protein